LCLFCNLLTCCSILLSTFCSILSLIFRSILLTFCSILCLIPCRDISNGAKLVSDWMDRMHAVVIGPGLGRDKDLLATVQVLCITVKIIIKESLKFYLFTILYFFLLITWVWCNATHVIIRKKCWGEYARNSRFRRTRTEGWFSWLCHSWLNLLIPEEYFPGDKWLAVWQLKASLRATSGTYCLFLPPNLTNGDTFRSSC